MMDRVALLTHLQELGISSDAFVLGQDRDEAYCVVQSPTGDWAVFYSERGHRNDERQFNTESAAYEDLLRRLVPDPTTRADYPRGLPPGEDA